MHAPATKPTRSDPGFAEFVALIALMMALTAMSIDVMLVALPDISAWFGLSDENARQYVITAYMLGFAAGQPFYGPLSDRYGRKPVLFAGVTLFAVGTVGAVVAPDYGFMLFARGVQGFGAAAARVIGVAIVRDLFAGRGMSKVMSFVMMVFITVPIVAPSLGSAILTVGDWRWIFLTLMFSAVAVMVWSWIRLPETLAPENVMPLSVATLRDALKVIVLDRQALGYTVATGFIFGSLIAYIGSAEQVFVDTYGLGGEFPLVFGAIAAVMIPASLVNAFLVERIGMRRLSHMALIGQIVACLAMAVAGFPPQPPLILFCAFLAVLFFSFGLMMPNFNAIAMEPLGRLAGTGSSFIGFYTTAVGAALGAVIGQMFDGTVQPILYGFSGLSVLALITVLWTERWRLFRVAPGAR